MFHLGASIKDLGKMCFGLNKIEDLEIIEKIINLELPDGAGIRCIIIIKKVKTTPSKYPRQFAKIKEKPL